MDRKRKQSELKEVVDGGAKPHDNYNKQITDILART
jgi:hypothetical protein